MKNNSKEIWLIDNREMSNVMSLLSADDEQVKQLMHVDNEHGSDRGDTDVAVINVHGPLFSRSDIVTQYYGLTTYESIEDQLDHYESNLSDGDKVYLDIDSGGGNANGLFQLCERLFKSKLNIITYVSGRAASAAFVIANATSKIIAQETAEVGCLGVMTAYVEDDEKPMNLILSRYADNKIPDKDATQIGADKLETIMYQKIHRWRKSKDKFNIESLSESYGNGAMFFADDALEAKMIDEVIDINPIKNNNNGGHVTENTDVKQLEVAEPQVNVDEIVEAKLNELNARYEALLSSDAGKANPVEAMELAKDPAFSLDKAMSWLEKITPSLSETVEVEDTSDPIAEAFEKAGGSANLSTLLEDEAVLAQTKTKEPKIIKPKYGSALIDSNMLATGRFEGGLDAYNEIYKNGDAE